MPSRFLLATTKRINRAADVTRRKIEKNSEILHAVSFLAVTIELGVGSGMLQQHQRPDAGEKAERKGSPPVNENVHFRLEQFGESAFFHPFQRIEHKVCTGDKIHDQPDEHQLGEIAEERRPSADQSLFFLERVARGKPADVSADEPAPEMENQPYRHGDIKQIGEARARDEMNHKREGDKYAICTRENFSHPLHRQQIAVISVYPRSLFLEQAAQTGQRLDYVDDEGEKHDGVNQARQTR